MSLEALEECYMQAEVVGLKQDPEIDSQASWDSSISDSIPDLIPDWILDPKEEESISANVFAFSEDSLDTLWPGGGYFELEFDLPKDGPNTTVFVVDTSNTFEMSQVDDLIQNVAWTERIEGVKKLAEESSKKEDQSIKTILDGVTLPQDNHTQLSDVHVPESTIETLRSLTTLSLVAPDHFTYGVLSRSKASGVLLYGPPGTGKTLLAGAIAKEARAALLEISAAEINCKWHGESEKVIKAIFTVAQMLENCVIFIDEADGLFRTRSADEGRWYSTITNQFLREWDGINSKKKGGYFVMMATNRASDLDPAVLRRFQRQILVSLPQLDDRESIFNIHLKGEEIDDDVDILKLAALTDGLSGSDIKNICISAAYLYVYEEAYGLNGLAAKRSRGLRQRILQKNETQRRRLSFRHFERAIEENGKKVGSSSLEKIRKWGEVYADNARRMAAAPAAA